jgi:ABC-type bacteriocin/lantibiotic exporter with double-glycine peptidase domain
MSQKEVSFGQALAKLNKLLALDRSEIAAVYTFAVLAGLVQLSLPLGIQSIISFVMAGTLSTSIVVLIIMVVFGVFLNGLLQVRQLQVIEKIKQKIFVRFSLEFTDRLPKINIEKLDNEYLPEMVNRYFDSVSLQKGVDKLLVDLPAAIIQVVFGLILLSLYHPVFIAFGILLIITVLAVIRFTSQKGMLAAIDASSYKYGVAAWLQEIARSIKTFKYTKGTSLHMQKTDYMLGGYLNSRTAYFKVLLQQFWSLISFKIIITGAMLTIGSYLLITQQINVGQFIASDIVIIAIIGSIEKLITNLDAVYDALVSVEKLALITEADIEQSGNIELSRKNEGVEVDFKDVSFSYTEGQQVLQGISFSAKPGELLLLKGSSGAGKSTILRLLTGAFTAYEGKILIDQLPVANYSINSLRKETGILLSVQDIFQGTILENLTMGNPEISLDEINHLVRITGLQSYVESSRKGYDSPMMPGGVKLSNQVRKNILLIRALLGHNRLLLLEEPFAHLSNSQKEQVIKYIKEKKRATTLIASSDERLSDVSDQVILITNGSTDKPLT